jgi:tetratricopeptide (TPR) repeat protein
MSEVDWLEVLGWSGDELEDLRFVGYSYLKQGKYDIAITFFEALVVLNPTNAYDLQTLGGLHLQLNNNLMALNFIERALKTAPDHLPTRLNRAKALYALGYKRQAQKEAENLTQSADAAIADQASALLSAYA